MKPVIIFITLFSVSFGGSLRNVGALMESLMFYGNVNSSNVITDKYIGADTESLMVLPMEYRPSSVHWE